MSFDTTIHLGDVVAIVVFLATVAGMYVTSQSNMTRIETKVDTMFDWFKQNVMRPMNGKSTS